MTQKKQNISFEKLRSLVEQDNVLALHQERDAIIQQQETVDINGRGLFHAAVHAKAGDSLQWMIDQGIKGLDLGDNHGETPLMRAAWLGYQPAVDMLLEAGSDLQKTALSGGTALHFAYAGGQQAKGVAEKLLGAGANPDTLDKSGAKPDSWASQAVIRERGAALLAQPRGRSKLSMPRKTP